MSIDTFGALGVPSVLVDVLAARGITTPTPIQAATLPDSLAGRDVLGRGRTGSGKTIAFTLPLLARLAASRTPRSPKRPRSLVLAPTRELASQIADAMAPLAEALGLTTRTVFGGVGQGPQVAALRQGVDVLVACPGRLEDLIGQGHVSLSAVEVTVIDEADHMADLGFLPQVRRLLDATPRDGQRMLFSATLDAGIGVLANRYLQRPVTHEADSAQSPVAAMAHHVLHVAQAAHFRVLVDLAAAPGRTVVFTRTKHRAKKLARQLNGAGVAAVELHGNLSQGQRERTMAAFHSGAAQTLVATDIAARGIHVDDVALVVHADPPVEHKAYLHRSGRTARAGAAGTVVTLMTDEQVRDVRELTRKAGVRPTITRAHETHPVLAELAPGERRFDGAFVPPAGSGTTGGRRGTTSDDSAPRGSGPGRPPRRGRGRRGAGSGERTPASAGRGSGSAAGGGRSAGGRSQAGATGSRSASGGSRSGGSRGRAAAAPSAPTRSAADFSAGSRGRGRR